MASFDNVISDWDGVFTRTPGIWLEAIGQISLEYGLNLTREQLWILSAECEKAVEFGLPKDKLKDYMDKIRERGLPLAIRAPLYPGAAEMAERLVAAGKRLAIVSSNYYAAEIIKRNGLTSKFQAVVCSRQMKIHKPNPDGIFAALGMLRAEKTNAIYIGDAKTDIQAAANAGIPSVLFFPRCHSKTHDYDDLLRHKPTYVVRTHAQLGKLLTRSRNGN